MTPGEPPMTTCEANRSSSPPATTMAELVDAGASASALVALARLREAAHVLASLEADLDRHATQPLTPARWRELELAAEVLVDAANRLAAARRRLAAVK